MNHEELEREIAAAEATCRHFNIKVERRKLPEVEEERPKLRLIQGGKK